VPTRIRYDNLQPAVTRVRREEALRDSDETIEHELAADGYLGRVFGAPRRAMLPPLAHERCNAKQEVSVFPQLTGLAHWSD
jgi:hypothetical protein